MQRIGWNRSKRKACFNLVIESLLISGQKAIEARTCFNGNIFRFNLVIESLLISGSIV